MRLIFVHWVYEDRGSAQDLHNYAEIAKTLGHEIVIYGPRQVRSAFNYSLEINPADAVIFIFEWTTDLQRGDQLDLLRLVGQIPRRRRVVIDCDGKYNDALNVVGDYNHPDTHMSQRWVEICDSLADKIYQPTFHPSRPNVRSFLFHAYNPVWEIPLDFKDKQYGMYYVGNNWFRWQPMRPILAMLEGVRADVGRVGFVGYGWDTPAPWANSTIIEAAYYTDPDYLRQLEIEVQPPIHFHEVIAAMSKGVFTPVIYRPLFDHLQLVTCRTFETVAANTIPLFTQDAAFVREVYGAHAEALVLGPHGTEKILDVLRRSDYYADIVREMRCHLAAHHSYAARIKELIEMVTG
jgi:hypothetical protein